MKHPELELHPAAGSSTVVTGDVANTEFTHRQRHCELVTSSTKTYLMQRQNDCIAYVKKRSVEA